MSALSLCVASVACLASACGSSSDKKAARGSPDDDAGEAGQASLGGQASSLGGQAGSGTGGGSGGEGGTDASAAGAGGTGATDAGGAGGAGPAPDQCPTGFGDCDQDPDDCETPLDLVSSCGACDVSCSSTNGAVACQDLSCTVTSCLTGFGDCNDSGTDGCETPINTAANCGSCGNDCGTATCNVGGFCEATELGGNYYAGRALFAGASMYRLSVPAPNYAIQGSYSLVRIPVDGSAEVIVDAQSKQVGGMVADATDIYWGVGGTTAGVFKKGLNAPAADPPTPVFTPAALPMQMVIQGTAMYFMGSNGVIYTRSMEASVPSTEPGTAIVSAAQVAGTGTFNVHQPLVATPTRLYWIVAGTGAGILRTAPLAGGNATDVAGALPRTWMPPAVSGEDLYFVQANGSAFDGLYHYKVGGTVQGLVFKAGLTGVAVDSGSLYYLETETKLYKAPLSGGVGTQIGVAASSTKDIVGFGPKSTYLAGVWTRGNGFSYGKAFVLPK